MTEISLLISQTADCLLKFIIYIIPCVAILLILYKFCKLPSYVFRKLLHLVAFTCVTLMILVAKRWENASLAAVTIAVVVYPILSAFENRPWFSGLFVQKSDGETKRSLLMLFLMFAVLNAVSWGIFDKTFLGVAAILMWGIGDASAALVGIPYGKHKVISKFTDGKKSYEGTIAMFIAAFICGLSVLYFYGGIPAAKSVLCALLGALTGALVELVTSSERDTVTVPVAILVVLLIFC